MRTKKRMSGRVNTAKKGFIIALMYLVAAGAVQAQDLEPTGLWEFNDPLDLTNATVGADLTLGGSHSAVAGMGGSDGAALIGTISGSYYTAQNPVGGNGGGTYTNEYTLLWDVYFPAGSGWISFYQTNAIATSSDGDFFRNPSGGIGISGQYYGNVPADTWKRIVLTVDCGALLNFKSYMDGSLVNAHTVASAVDGRWALGSVFHFFGDEDGEDGPKRVTNLAFWGRTLTAQEVASLGGAGIPILDAYVIVTETGGSTAVTEGGANDTYDLKLGAQPSQNVLITAAPSDAEIDLGAGPGAAVILTFTSTNWDTAQTVTVTAVDDDVYEGKIPHTTNIDHTTQSLDDNYNDITVASVAVSVTDNEEICGDWGYNPRDLNHDCYVNLLDFAEFARYWLESISQ